MISCGFHPQFLHSSGGLAHFCFNGTPDNGQMGPLSVYGTFHHLYHWDCCYGVARRVRSTTAGCVRLCYLHYCDMEEPAWGCIPSRTFRIRAAKADPADFARKDIRRKMGGIAAWRNRTSCAPCKSLRHNVARREHRSWLWLYFMNSAEPIAKCGLSTSIFYRM